MNKLRSREFTRVAGSFLLAVGFHALFFLLQINGLWGASGDSLEYTLIHPQLIEIEPPKAKVPTPTAKVTPEQKPAPQPPVPEKPPVRPEEEEAVVKLEEVHQEQPAPRETKAEPGEPLEQSPEEPSTPSEETATGEDQTLQAPEVPVLPPLGSAGGMVLFAPGFSYPKDAQHLDLEAVVQLELYLTSEGTLLKEPLMIISSGHPELDKHCLKMFDPKYSKAWKFKPAPQPYKILFEVRFENYKVEPRYVGEAVYLSTEEGGEIDETETKNQ